MRDNTVIQTVALATILGSAAAILLIEHGGFGPGIKAGTPQATGAELARQAVSFLKPGGQIMVINRATTMYQNPATDLQMKGFQRELARTHNQIGTVQTLQLDPLRPIEVPVGDFQNWIHLAASGDVIVSFLGPPLLSQAQVRQLGEIKPAIVAFCPGNWPNQLDFRPLFGNGLLRSAILSRHGQEAGRSNPNNSRAEFDANYEVVTAANVEAFMAATEKSTAPAGP